jgi:predicted nuclease of restriction endonuclease-like RecB superfamily
MLPLNLVRVKNIRSRLAPQYLDPSADSWRDIAEQLLEMFRGQTGRSRGELEEDLEDLIGNHPGQIIFQGLAKLLEDRCEFEIVSSHPPDEIREKVFLLSAAQRKSGAFERGAALAQVGTELGLSAEVVEQGLYADLKSEQRVIKFEDTTVTRLLERYNVALAQAILLRSTGVTATVRNETPARFRQLFRSIKFHRLMCDAEQTAPGTTVLKLDGPLSLFSATQKYGMQLAMFLPTLLQCRDFELRADVRWGAQKKEKTFVLTSSDGLVSHLPDHASYTPPDLQMFVELFRKKAQEWDIQEEADVISLGRAWWAPDFRLTHRPSGRFVYLEVLGFWRRGGAEAHLQRLRKNAKQPFLLAVSDSLKIDDAELEGLPAEIHRFRQMPQPDEIVRLAEALVPNLFGSRNSG